jgi:hypothetical protein
MNVSWAGICSQVPPRFDSTSLQTIPGPVSRPSVPGDLRGHEAEHGEGRHHHRLIGSAAERDWQNNHGGENRDDKSLSI